MSMQRSEFVVYYVIINCEHCKIKHLLPVDIDLLLIVDFSGVMTTEA